ncbi:hypothetical protein D3875_04205 [Deinococcus cavernae]|uniref:Uncharacterized protein n=1 Tax=Deinococcus cavernae TaxID=2320857 RepID=A0A418VEF6_9DEIO|nr:hypothetical protein [Deinococcus cavernae]RJF74490.1 hypothetical protein D3875_04205 [Deinococcus cavernae]
MNDESSKGGRQSRDLPPEQSRIKARALANASSQWGTVAKKEGQAGIQAKTQLSAQKLAEENLPAYWSREWYMQQYEQAGQNFEEMGRVTGYSPSTLRRFGLRYHGLQLQNPRRDDARRLVTEAWANGEQNKLHLAQRFGVSIGSVASWVADLQEHRRIHVSTPQRLAMAGPFPAETAEVAQRAFEGDLPGAAAWLSRLTKKGLLRRIAPGRYDLPLQAVSEESP